MSEDHLVGFAEAAAMLGLSKQALADRRKRQDFPAPVAELAAGPVWHREQIVDYARDRSTRLVERESVQELASSSESAADIAEVLGAEDIAELCDESVEWVESQRFRLPCTTNWRTGELTARRQDLPRWLEAARSPRVERVHMLGPDDFR